MGGGASTPTIVLVPGEACVVSDSSRDAGSLWTPQWVSAHLQNASGGDRNPLPGL